MKHISKVHIRFADIDAMGHVNNAVYLNYFEQARMAWFQELIQTKWDWKTAGIILARNEIDYHRPVLLQDHVEIETTVDEIGTKSMTLSYKVVKIKGEDRILCAGGRSVIVCFDHSTQQTIPVPETWRERITVGS